MSHFWIYITACKDFKRKFHFSMFIMSELQVHYDYQIAPGRHGSYILKGCWFALQFSERAGEVRDKSTIESSIMGSVKSMQRSTGCELVWTKWFSDASVICKFLSIAKHRQMSEISSRRNSSYGVKIHKDHQFTAQRREKKKLRIHYHISWTEYTETQQEDPKEMIPSQLLLSIGHMYTERWNWLTRKKRWLKAIKTIFDGREEEL